MSLPSCVLHGGWRTACHSLLFPVKKPSSGEPAGALFMINCLKNPRWLLPMSFKQSWHPSSYACPSMNTLTMAAGAVELGTQPLVDTSRAGIVVRMQRSVMIDRPVSEVYAFWRNLENLPSFMKHLKSVTILNESTSYWMTRSSEKHLWGWGVELTEDREDQTISWRSIADADIHTAGSVHFFPAPNNPHGTVINLIIKCTRPADKFLASTAKVFIRDVEMTMGGDLASLKTILEESNAAIKIGERRYATRPSCRPVALAGQFCQ
jgi:uncharacterized membrane protein